jgi:hypothetical protein
MKSLTDYIDKLTMTDSDNITEDDAMKKLRRYAQVDLVGNEGLYDTEIDRWSRNAKHPLSKVELLSANDLPNFTQGDIAMFEGKEVEVRIPQGPKQTTGIMLEGHLTMVKTTKLDKIEEGVMGGVRTMTPINRIMQLAGLEHGTSVIAEPTVAESEEDTESEVIAEETLEEDNNIATAFSKLVTSAPPPYNAPGNEEAARLYVMGGIISAIAKDLQTSPLQSPTAINSTHTLNSLAPMGAALLQTAQTLANKKPGTPQ